MFSWYKAHSFFSNTSLFLIFIFTLFCLTILYWFCHTLTWISHRCTWVPNPEPPSHLPPHIISLNFDAEYIMRNSGLDEAQAGIKIAGRNINSLKYADDTTLNGRKWRTKEPIDHQSMFDTGYRMLGAGALGWPREMIWGGWWEGGSGLGTHVHPWRIHVNVWQNQYSIVK